jgi:hypothetical protein
MNRIIKGHGLKTNTGKKMTVWILQNLDINVIIKVNKTMVKQMCTYLDSDINSEEQN